jgi:hypothetical protein
LIGKSEVNHGTFFVYSRFLKHAEPAWNVGSVDSMRIYFHMQNTLWDLQPTVLAYAQATDQLSGSNYHGEFMALDEDGNGSIDDLEFGTNGMWDCFLAGAAIAYNLIGKSEVNHGTFFVYSRFLKHAEPAWNVGSVDSMRIYMDTTAFTVASQLANGPEGTDPFFGIPYGTGDEGIPKWPSLQFARYGLEMSMIYDYMYSNAKAYSEQTGKPFRLYVPNSVPYAPASASGKPLLGYNPKGLPNVVELDPSHADYSRLVFTVEFSEIW